MNAERHPHAARNERLFRTISYALVFLMMSCVVLTLSILIHNLLPGWHPNVFAGILLFLVLDRFYTYQQLKSMQPWTSEWAIAHAVHWVVIIIFGRLLLSYAGGLDALRADLLLFTRGDLVELLTPELVILMILAFATWQLTTHFLELLDEIGLDMNLALRDIPTGPQTQIPAHQRLVSLMFSTGVVLVILTVLTRLNLGQVLTSSRATPLEVSRFSGAEAGALMYFVFGLALLSLSRLMSLQTHWYRLHIPVSSKDLPRQWAIYSLIFLLLLAMLVGFLPAGDSVGFFSVVATLFVFLMQALFMIAQLIITLFILLVSLPFLLFGKTPPFVSTRPPVPTPTPLPDTLSTPTSNITWELLKSILLWGALIAVLLFALTHFLRQHNGLLPALRSLRIVDWMKQAWGWLYRNANRTREELARALKGGWQNLITRLERRRVLSRPGWISLRTLDPRRKVYFYYLAMLRRAAKEGYVRKPSQTPLEYALQLERNVPSAVEDIESLTDAFVEARYSRQPVESSKAALIKETWGRIRRALQVRSKDGQS